MAQRESVYSMAKKGKYAMSDNNSNGDSPENLERLSVDLSDNASASVIRENARLQLDNNSLKQRVLRVWAAVIILGMTLFITVGSILLWFPKYRYIPTTDNTAICEVGTEGSPRISPPTLTEFAKDAAVSAYSYDYINYREALNETAGKWFSDDGRKAYLRSLDESGNLDKVIKGRFILRTMSTNVAQLETEGMRGLTNFWTVLVPIAIEFYSGGEIQPRTRQDFIATVTIIQVPASATNQKGIVVDSISLSPTFTRK